MRFLHAIFGLSVLCLQFMGSSKAQTAGPNVVLGIRGNHRSPRFTDLTREIGKSSNENLLEYERLIGLGLPRNFVLTLLRNQRHPICSLPPVRCNQLSRYRNINGTCNNILNPSWGSSYMPFQRIFQADFSDGYNRQKGLPPHKALPNARVISSTVHPDLIHPDSELTNMVPQVGQFLDHDFALSIEDERHCCTTERDHVDCWPIQIPKNDVFYSNISVKQTCMDFTRSTPYCFPTSSGIREPFNIDTSYVDASNVYGSEDERTMQIREFQGGRLQMSTENPKLIVSVIQAEDKLNAKIEFMGKFLAGDNRVNEMPALAVMHILWVREHNRIADMLSVVRPQWNDETVFQETRRIVIAEWQNVVYGQFLQTVMGQNTMLRYGLDLGPEDAFSVYNPNLDATLFHSFATAAYRFGHTLLNGLIRLVRGFSEVGSYLVRDNYFDSAQVEQNQTEGYDLILGGLMSQNAQTYDRFISADFTNFLLKDKENDFGADLVARNIQRGRDHAIASYNTYRQACDLSSLQGWNSRPAEILDETWQKLRSVYASPQDIELFPGGIAEIPIRGAASGPTFNCLKAFQFQRLKFGDRYFFTHQNQRASFNRRQLTAIRRRTLGDIICENSDLEQTTSNVFKIVSARNPWVNCTAESRARIDINIFL